MKFRDALIEQIRNEVGFQTTENEKGTENYRLASEYHTNYIQELNEVAEKYPHFVEVILQKHIDEEDEIFGGDTTEYDLTQHEKGRIYSLVRCRHMIRIAKEQSE